MQLSRLKSSMIYRTALRGTACAAEIWALMEVLRTVAAHSNYNRTMSFIWSTRCSWGSLRFSCEERLRYYLHFL